MTPSRMLQVVVIALDSATAAFAALSAWWWWKASVFPIPPPKTCFDECGPTDPFVVAFHESANLNATAAKLAAVAAFLLTLSILGRLVATVIERRRGE